MRVAQLWRFPVKSLGGERIDEVEVDDHGIVGDRWWGIVDVATGTVLTARRAPALLFAEAWLVGADSVAIRLPDGTEATDDRSLSHWLGRAVRLERAAPDRRGTYETALDFEHEAGSAWTMWQGPAGTFHDSTQAQLSIVSLESIASLETLTSLEGTGPHKSTGPVGCTGAVESTRRLDIRRFRPNVVVDVGAEDELIGSAVTLGTVTATVVKPLGRCVDTTRAQPGLSAEIDVLRAINLRKAGKLGVGALVVKPGTISVGDAALVIRAPGELAR